MSNKIKLQDHATDLQSILDTINALPEAGAGDAYAVIAVTYPEGSICTCSNGSETLELDNDVGYGFFLVPEDGKWTVTSTDKVDSTKTKSAEVEITKEGQFESVTLNYALVLIENGNLAQGYVWENPDVYAPVYKVIKPIITNIKQYKNMVYTIYIDTLVNTSAYFEIGLFSGLSHASSAVQITKYDQNSGILNAGNAKEFVVPIASTVPNDCYIGTYSASLQGHIIDLRLE